MQVTPAKFISTGSMIVSALGYALLLLAAVLAIPSVFLMVLGTMAVSFEE